MNFNSVLIGSEDPAKLAAYYTGLLGEPSWTDQDYTGWIVGSGVISIGPHSEVKGANATPGRLLLNIESDDVKGDFERWKAAGAIVVAEPYNFDESPDTWIATFADPDNNYFQLMSPMGPPQG